MRKPSRRKPKLLALDLDGTFLSASGEPHPKDVKAVRAALDAGITVSILTGRLYSGTRPAAEIAGIRGPVGCVDGSHVVDTTSHSTLLHHGIRGPHALRLRDSLARSGPATFLFAQDAIVHDAAGDSYLGYVSTWSTDIRRAEAIAAHDLWSHDDGVTAVVAVGTSEQINEVAQEIQVHLAEIAQVAIFPVRKLLNHWGLVARASHGTKGTALRWLAQHHGCDLDETVVVGDWHNDISMFQEAGRAYAMGQAPDDVKAYATNVLAETAFDGGGVARVVEEAFGLKVR